MGPSSRLAWALVCALSLCGLVAALIGVVGVVGVRHATGTGRSIVDDELSTANATAVVTHEVDGAYADAQALLRAGTTTEASRLNSRLLDQDIPSLEADLGTLQRLHSGDGTTEKADIEVLSRQWVALRSDLNRSDPASAPDAASARLSAAYQPLSRHLEDLTEQESVDARADQGKSSSDSDHVVTGIALTVALSLLLFLALGIEGSRRLRRALEPAQEQVEFADTLQLAQDESEAHSLLQRHLQRTVSGSAVTVLNRNNSADRLEAVTSIPDGSPLLQSLTHALPRSCLAVRSGRPHEESVDRASLMGCAICEPCAGHSTCTPLTVSGEVIGSVLVNRPARYKTTEQQHVRDAVSQAAPVLANLRNLAIAEVRAATDSLTGLPNKRAVGDTMKRMLAQAIRSSSSMSLLVLDLDHFKQVNDRFGHQVGDQALANVGAVLRGVLREGDFAGRNGGEEFAVVLPDTTIGGALVTAEKILTAIADINVPGLDLTMTVSIGLAAYPEHGSSPERLERLADSALYTAKRSGRNRVEVAQSEVEGAARLSSDLLPVTLAPPVNGTAPAGDSGGSGRNDDFSGRASV